MIERSGLAFRMIAWLLPDSRAAASRSAFGPRLVLGFVRDRADDTVAGAGFGGFARFGCCVCFVGLVWTVADAGRWIWYKQCQVSWTGA